MKGSSGCAETNLWRGQGQKQREQSGGKISDGGGSTRVPLPELESGQSQEDRGSWTWIDLGVAQGGDGGVQEPWLMEHPRTVGQSQVESEPLAEEVGFTVNLVVKAGAYRILGAQCLKIHVRGQIPQLDLHPFQSGSPQGMSY